MSKVVDKKKYIILDPKGEIIEVHTTTPQGLKTICKRLKKQYDKLYIAEGLYGCRVDIRAYLDDYNFKRMYNSCELTMNFHKFIMV